LKESYIDLREKIVIIALHGTEGEDGTLQRFLEDGHVLYTGTGSAASALAFDKQRTKQLAREHDLPVPEDITIQEFSALKEEQLKKFLRLSQKIVMKPNANGSSVGLYIISNEEELMKAISEAREKKLTNYLCEPFIAGREITVGVRERSDLTLKALPCSEVRVKTGRQFDYEGKYLGSGVEELTPAPLPPEIARECQKLAIEMHKLVGCEGYSRTDMILTERGPYLLEINTLPGLSKASFIPQQLKADGMSLREFFQEQINLL
jgi:D-alanine-D-alanine ligase